MNKRLFILNNYKNNQNSDAITEIRDYAKKSGIAVSDYLYRFTKEDLISLITSDNFADRIKLRMFLDGLFEEIKQCDLLYVNHDDEVFDQLNRIIIAKFISEQEIIVESGDIDKLLNRFLITEDKINESEENFYKMCIICGQHYLFWRKNLGISTEPDSDFNKDRLPVMHFSAFSDQELVNLNPRFEPFNLLSDPNSFEDNPPTIRNSNVLVYTEESIKYADIWLIIGSIDSLDSVVSNYILSTIEATPIMKALSNDIIRIKKDETGLSFSRNPSLK